MKKAMNIMMVLIITTVLMVVLIRTAIHPVQSNHKDTNTSLYGGVVQRQSDLFKDRNLSIYSGVIKRQYDLLNGKATVESNDTEIVGDSQNTTMYATTRLNVRNNPVDGNIVYTLNKGQAVEVLHPDDNEWIVINVSDVNNITGYVNSTYLTNEPIKKNEYTDNDLYILSHLIMGESGGESDLYQLCVGSVVLNRLNDKRFGDTLHDVVFQNGQYACTVDGNYYKQPTDKCISNARQLLEYGSILPQSVVWQAGFEQGNSTYLTVGNGYFCN